MGSEPCGCAGSAFQAGGGIGPNTPLGEGSVVVSDGEEYHIVASIQLIDTLALLCDTVMTSWASVPEYDIFRCPRLKSGRRPDGTSDLVGP